MSSNALSHNGAGGPSIRQDQQRRFSPADVQLFPQVEQREGLSGLGVSGGFMRLPGRAYPVEAQRESPIRGLIQAYIKTCQRWRLSESDQLRLLGFDANSFIGQQLFRGRLVNIPQDAKDRASYIVAISVGLGSVFAEAVDAELAWLNRVHPKLQNKSPLHFMLEGRMMNIILVSNLVSEERHL